MARVTVEDCVDKIPNRFELVLLSAQRARQISGGAELTIDRDRDKNPVVALREVAEQTVKPRELEEALIGSLQRVQVDEDDVADEVGSLSAVGRGAAPHRRRAAAQQQCRRRLRRLSRRDRRDDLRHCHRPLRTWRDVRSLRYVGSFGASADLPAYREADSDARKLTSTIAAAAAWRSRRSPADARRRLERRASRRARRRAEDDSYGDCRAIGAPGAAQPSVRRSAIRPVVVPATE